MNGQAGVKPRLRILETMFSVHRLEPEATIPTSVLAGEYCWTARTPDELSLVCPEHINLPDAKTEAGWNCIMVMGPLQFELTGILAGLSNTLADAGIALFAISTFDTDYLLVKSQDIDKAQTALTAKGYSFISPDCC